MRKIQMLVVVIAGCFMASTGLPQSKPHSRKMPLPTGRYRAKRIPWKGPTEIKDLKMRLLTTLYGDVSNPNGIAVPDDVIQNFDLSPDGNTLACAYFPAILIIWDTQTGARKKEIALNKATFGNIACSPDGITIVTTTRSFSDAHKHLRMRAW